MLKQVNGRNKPQNTYYIVDVLKFIFCLCVIGIHTEIHMVNSVTEYWLLKAVFRLAVPFFMICTAFFLAEKFNRSKQNSSGSLSETMKNFSARLLMLLIVFEPISVVLKIILWAMNGKNTLYIFLKSVQHIIFYPLGALWYIQAVLIGAWIAFFFWKRNKVTLGICAGGGLYVFALICNSYYFLVEGTAFQKIVDLYIKLCLSARNGLFLGLFMVLLGFKCYDIHMKAVLWSRKQQISIFAVSTIVLYVLYLIELALLQGKDMADDESLFIVLPVLSVSLLLLATRFISQTDHRGTVILRNMSTGMYLLHSPVIRIVEIMSILVGSTCSSSMLFVVVVLTTSVICIMSYKFKLSIAKYLK